MPDLENLLEHKKGSKVFVNGTIYDIGLDGVAKDVKDDDAEKLLKNASTWQVWDGTTPDERVQEHRAQRMRLLGADGAPVEPPKLAPVPPGLPPESPKAPKPAKSVGTGGEYVVPKEGEDWPDPTDQMPIEYLKLMADAYELKYKGRVKKAKLVEQIHEAMYNDD